MPRSTNQQVLTEEMEAACLRDRIEGKTFEEIAVAVGYGSRSGALKAYRRALNRLGMEQVEEVIAFSPLVSTRCWRSFGRRCNLETVRRLIRLFG